MLSMKKKTLVLYLSVVIILLSFIYRNDISIVYKSLSYKSEIDYAKSCIELLSEGNENKLRRIFIDNARFFSHPEYIKETSQFLKEIKIEDLRLKRLSSSKEDAKDLMFLDFYSKNSSGIKNIRLKIIRQSNGWFLYSLMLG